MMNLDKMTKQLDALTYNSRSVLNAMVRSTMKSGSANGFTVTRGGEKIVLSRTDIYRLYAFYQDWEYKISYATDTTFDELLAEHDAKYIGEYQGSSKSTTVSSTPTTDALVKHAKIMYQTDDNKGSETSYWLGLVKSSTNAKLLTNTAPIPINIRTPIYDENLSTKHFDQLETYLFPIAYNALDILGYGGDNSDHLAGGKTWTFDVDDKFTVTADAVILGSNDSETSYIRSFNKVGTSPLHTVSYGVNCYNYNNNSMAGGLQNQTVGLNSLAIGGERNIAYDTDSVVIGGYHSSSVGNYSAVIAGTSNFVTAPESLVSGSIANAGGYAYYFQRYLSSTSEVKETTCDPTYTDPDTGCVYALKLDSDGSSASNGRSLTNTQVFITNGSRQESMIGSNKLSEGDSTKNYSAFDFKIGDTVKLFNYGTLTNAYVNAGVEILATVEGIEYYNNGYIITLDKDVTTPTGFIGTVAYGRIMRYHIKAYPVLNNSGAYSDSKTFASNSSVALNYNTIAAGIGQTVVGTSNAELIRPNFIVGNGCSYINGEAYRSNGLVVSPNYSYMKTNSNYVGFGVSNYGTAYIDEFGESGDEDDLANRRYDEDYMYGIYKFTGVYAYSFDGKMIDHAVMRTNYKRSELTINDNGIRIYQPYQYGYGNNVNVLMGSKDGAVIVHAGDDGQFVSENDEDVTWQNFYKNKLACSSINDKSLLLWSCDDAAIKGHNVKVYSSSYLIADFDHLSIRGETYGELANAVIDDYCFSHNFQAHGIMYPNTIADTGFYYGKLRQPTASGRYVYPPSAFNVPTNVSTLHVINSTVKTGNEYDVSQLIMPGAVDTDVSSAIPHIMFVTNTIYGRGNQDVDPTAARSGYVIAEELAYLSDISSSGKQVFNKLCPTNPYVPSNVSAETGDNFLPVGTDGSVYRISTCDYFENAAAQNSDFISSTATGKKLISTTTFSAKYGSKFATMVDYQYFTYFLNGVGINPGYQARFFSDNKGKTDYQGYAFIGFAPSSFNSGSLLLPYSYSDGTVYSSITTSPHSKGASSMPINCSSIWATMIDYNSDGYYLAWVKIADNLQVTYNNGNLLIEFDFYPSIKCSTTISSAASKLYKGGRMRAFTLKNNGTKALTADESYEYGGTENSTSLDKRYFTTMTLPIPLDSSFGTKVSSLKNTITGVQHNLYGRAYYTGDTNVSVSGWISQTAPVYNHDDDRDAYRSYVEPVVQVNIAGITGLAANTFFHVKLEGAATYAD